jgi:putative transposase
MHVHLLFVTKYRKTIFDGAAISYLRMVFEVFEVFEKVCADFKSTLAGMDGE